MICVSDIRPASSAKACVVSAQPAQNSTKSPAKTSSRMPLRDIACPSKLSVSFICLAPLQGVSYLATTKDNKYLSRLQGNSSKKTQNPVESGQRTSQKVRKGCLSAWLKYRIKKPQMQAFSPISMIFSMQALASRST